MEMIESNFLREAALRGGFSIGLGGVLGLEA